MRDKQIREAAKAAQTTDKTPISSTSSCSEVDSPVITDTRSARVNPGMAKKCVFNFDEKQMMEMHEDMEKNLDLNQILNAKSAKGGNPSPVIQGKCFKKRLDKFFTGEAMIAMIFICQNTGPGTQQNKEVGSGCTERELFGAGNSA